VGRAGASEPVTAAISPRRTCERACPNEKQVLLVNPSDVDPEIIAPQVLVENDHYTPH
jgi:hypothetical protein